MSFIGRIDPQDPALMPSVNAVALHDIKSMLRPIFWSSAKEADLKRRLDRRGFMVRPHDGQSYLATAPHGKLVCRVADIVAV